ncbi:putative histone-lysine N-methyltransferase Mes-4, partial [Toxocara canis]
GKEAEEKKGKTTNDRCWQVRKNDWTRECFVCVMRESTEAASMPKKCITNEELLQCSACKTKFHRNCFLSFREGDFVPRMHVLDATGDPCMDLSNAKKWLCPQHECNYCNQELLRTRSQMGRLLACVDCVFAWHKTCVIIGSHHIDRQKDKFVMCPRHADVSKSSSRHTSFCILCFGSLAGCESKLECRMCIRAYCKCYFNGLSSEDIAKQKRAIRRGEFVCESCEYHDYPRIGDYVLAISKGYLWPAKTLHADLLPTSLLSNAKLVARLQEPGYVLIQWIEGLIVPNYDVVSFRDVVAFPVSVKCPIWNRFKAHKNILNAVRELYAKNEIHFGVNRPLPDEVKRLRAPQYKKVQTSINGRLARSNMDELGQCTCEVVNGKRCTLTHGCLNRSVHMECPKNCDELFAEMKRQKNSRNSRTREMSGAKVGRRNANSVKADGVCVNNFLRNHKRGDDDEWMEERQTADKGFGVFAKKPIHSGKDLTEYVGRVMPKDEYFDELNFIATFNNLEMSYFGMQITNEFYVDARNYGNMSRSVNHSCDPNCAVNAVTVDGVYRLKVSALRDIAQGEELTYDYGTELWNGMVGMRCRCGAETCRGIIGKLANGGSRKEHSSNDKIRQEKSVPNGKAQGLRQNRAVKRLLLSADGSLPKMPKEVQIQQLKASLRMLFLFYLKLFRTFVVLTIMAHL